MHQEKSLYNNFLIFFFLWPLPWFLQRRNEFGENKKVPGYLNKMGLNHAPAFPEERKPARDWSGPVARPRRGHGSESGPAESPSGGQKIMK